MRSFSMVCLLSSETEQNALQTSGRDYNERSCTTSAVVRLRSGADDPKQKYLPVSAGSTHLDRPEVDLARARGAVAVGGRVRGERALPEERCFRASA